MHARTIHIPTHTGIHAQTEACIHTHTQRHAPHSEPSISLAPWAPNQVAVSFESRVSLPHSQHSQQRHNDAQTPPFSECLRDTLKLLGLLPSPVLGCPYTEPETKCGLSVCKDWIPRLPVWLWMCTGGQGTPQNRVGTGASVDRGTSGVLACG